MIHKGLSFTIHIDFFPIICKQFVVIFLEIFVIFSKIIVIFIFHASISIFFMSQFVWIDCWILSFGCDAWNYTVVFNVNNFEKCVTWSQLCIQQRGKCSFGYNQLDLRLIETECARATEQTDVYLLQCQQDRLRIKFWWRFIFAVVQTLARCCCWFFSG